MYKTFDEKDIVDKVLSGDREAFRMLIRQYEGLVLHIVTPMIGVNEDREDISQDIFVKVYQKLHTFQFRSKLGTWIGHIAYHAALNFLKKKHVVMRDLMDRVEDDGGHLLADMETAEDIIIRSEDAQRLINCIDQLKPLQRTSLLLFYQEELSLDEIGGIMGIPVNTVKSHLFRGKGMLKNLMEKPF